VGAQALAAEFFEQDVVELARALLGCRLIRDGVGGTIVETEAYREDEPACHAFRGQTPRNRSMFLAGGRIYVYRIHQSVCVNVVCGPIGAGHAVLIRAIRPEFGRALIAERRGRRPAREWTNGPGKLCQALGISLGDDGTCARGGPVRVEPNPLGSGCFEPGLEVQASPRVGISKAVELPWRFRLM
jgi:DNA-3-methyladenine glycosylase